jgi:hypothetical protein
VSEGVRAAATSIVDGPLRERVAAALGPLLDGTRIAAMRTETIGTGQMSESRRVHLTYEGATRVADGGGAATGTRDRRPTTLIVKFPSLDTTSRATGRAVRAYEIETRFYRELRPRLGEEPPRCWYAWRDEETDDFLLLLEDLAPCRQGDQLAGCSHAEAIAAIDALAGLHAPLWGAPELASATWLARSTSQERGRTHELLARLWPGFLERYGNRVGEEVVRVGAAFVDDPGDYFIAALPSHTLVHGDYRLDNLLFAERAGGVQAAAEPERRGGLVARIVDFQTVSHGCGMQDLSYFLGAGLLPDDRRAHERALVARWREALAVRGVGTDADEVWHWYRRYAVAGLIMAVVASMIVKRTERGDGMFLAMASRHARHALDVDASGALRA